ncbi:DUF3253 domain-containing protein [Rhizobium sp. ZW T2_16]|uniref:DUF3253 domain-containing protein n=1 Tax=Rhizobium sp. ZW T2_16 TaxID=3378083 RepID=UPI00385524AC
MSEQAVSAILSFVASRPTGTTCPSEVARSLAKDNNAPLDWREYMPIVHDAVDDLVELGEIVLTWKSSSMTERSGPDRISSPHKQD